MKKILNKIISSNKKIENVFGPHIDGNTWMFGDKVLDLKIDDLAIKNKQCTGTMGLYELIFMNDPDPYVYTEETYGEL